MDFLREQPPPWPWSQSLAGVSPDPSHIYQVLRVLPRIAEERCAEIGLAPGTRIRPRFSTGERVVLEFPDDGGRMERLAVTYAWYVQVKPEDRKAIPAPASMRQPVTRARRRPADERRDPAPEP